MEKDQLEKDQLLSQPPNAQGLYPCCADEANLEIRPSDRPDVVLRVCKICNRRHFEWTVDAGELGLDGSRL